MYRDTYLANGIIVNPGKPKQSNRVKVTLALSDPYGRSLSRFLWNEATTEVLLLPPKWDTSPSQNYLQKCTPGWIDTMWGELNWVPGNLWPNFKPPTLQMILSPKIWSANRYTTAPSQNNYTLLANNEKCHSEPRLSQSPFLSLFLRI